MFHKIVCEIGNPLLQYERSDVQEYQHTRDTYRDRAQGGVDDVPPLAAPSSSPRTLHVRPLDVKGQVGPHASAGSCSRGAERARDECQRRRAGEEEEEEEGDAAGHVCDGGSRAETDVGTYGIRECNRVRWIDYSLQLLDLPTTEEL